MNISQRLARDINDPEALEDAKNYVDRQVDEACRSLLDEMRAADELLKLFPGADAEDRTS